MVHKKCTGRFIVTNFIRITFTSEGIVQSRFHEILLKCK